jgi:NADH-quinone oxidoreductase subunit I
MSEQQPDVTASAAAQVVSGVAPGAGGSPEAGDSADLLDTRLPARSRGVIALLEQNCTVCMVCARECPSWCITIDSHKETVPAASPTARPRSQNALDRFAIDFSLCMYCSICIEVCPFDALFWSPEYAYPEPDPAGLIHERDRLQSWMRTVPPPESTA